MCLALLNPKIVDWKSGNVSLFLYNFTISVIVYNYKNKCYSFSEAIFDIQWYYLNIILI